MPCTGWRHRSVADVVPALPERDDGYAVAEYDRGSLPAPARSAISSRARTGPRSAASGSSSLWRCTTPRTSTPGSRTHDAIPRPGLGRGIAGRNRSPHAPTKTWCFVSRRAAKRPGAMTSRRPRGTWLPESRREDASVERATMRKRHITSESQAREQAFWYKDALIYELHVRAFYDSNGDGIGDFPGLTQKLGYLHDLGITALWLLPFYPSPLKDDGYDIADYTDVHPSYGTLHDFKVFLKEAHRHGLKVITELVLNHTSDQHPWFQRACHAKPDHIWRHFYVWSDSPEKYTGTRIIFKDFESSNWSWDPVANAYYWHRFYSHQPDLNYDNPHVRQAILNVVDFWFELGVDGLRLDAVPYLFEREGTTSENLPETDAALRRLRRHIDQHYPNRMLLAEANQWPEDAAAYFGAGDECHMVFHFPLMPRLFIALRTEDRLAVEDILA